MAFPIVLVNSATGSDTAASGAGPATAITGSTGRTRNTAAQLRFGFFGATDDFSGVAVDGSATLYAAIATSGIRNHSSLSAIKNTRQTGTDAAITTATAILVVGSTTGWAVEDVIKVAGAGAAAADLYSTVLTVDSAVQATLNDTAGTTVTAAAWENPKQGTLTTGEGMNTGTTNTVWAVGGVRASIGGTNSKKLAEHPASAAGDAMPGWIVEMQSGHAETLTALIQFRRDGSLANGPIILRGTAGAITPPILTFSNNGSALIMEKMFQQCRDFELRNTNATKTSSYGLTLGNTSVAERIRIDHATDNFLQGVGGAGTIRDCRIGNCVNFGVRFDGPGRVINCYIFTNGSHGLNVQYETGVVIRGTLVYNNTGDGLRQKLSVTTNLNGIVIDGNVFVANGSDGIEFTGAASATVAAGLVLVNNILSSNGGYGINLTGETLTQFLAQGPFVERNNTFGNTSGASFPTGLDPTDPGLDPQFVNAAGENFSIGANLKALGFPVGGTRTVGLGTATYSYIDIGAAQRLEAGGGLMINPGLSGGLR